MVKFEIHTYLNSPYCRFKKRNIFTSPLTLWSGKIDTNPSGSRLTAIQNKEKNLLINLAVIFFQIIIILFIIYHSRTIFFPYDSNPDTGLCSRGTVGRRQKVT